MEMTAQEPFIFSGTIRENMRLACPDADGQAIWRALADVGLIDEIRSYLVPCNRTS
jgi:ABC-type transport system involved in cytochrome bd biosynthesis fused ATPase/permease subunit